MNKKLQALALSALLAANSAGACDDLFSVTGEDQDRDGNTTYHATLTEWARANQTDSTVVRLGGCFIDLMGGSPGMASVTMDGKTYTINDAEEMADF